MAHGSQLNTPVIYFPERKYRQPHKYMYTCMCGFMNQIIEYKKRSGDNSTTIWSQK